MKDDFQSKILQLNNKLVDAKAEMEKSGSKSKPRQPHVHHPSTSGSSIVAESINNAVGWYSFYVVLTKQFFLVD
jgi:hypothetical protein